MNGFWINTVMLCVGCSQAHVDSLPQRMNRKHVGRPVNDHAQRVTQLAFRRDLVPPIALIDGERVVSRFEKCELGPKPKSVHELPEYFRSFER